MVAPGTASTRINHLISHLLSDLEDMKYVDEEKSWIEVLTQWFGADAGDLPNSTTQELTGWIQETLAGIDELLELQLKQILHAATLQKLESSWRGLSYLVENVKSYSQVKVVVLDVSWEELASDAQSTIVFDHTRIFKHVYETEFGSPGGQPLGLLVGDFEVSHLPKQSADTLSLIRQLSGTAAAAFTPLILGATPEIFGADDLPSLERGIDLQRTFAQNEYLDWQSWCASPDARFFGLALPRFMVRAPYTRTMTPGSDFLFTERCSSHSDYLWCNASFAVATVIARSYGETGWFDDFLGPALGDERRGVLPKLPLLTHHSDLDWPLPPIEWAVPDSTAQTLAESGFICLRHCKYTPEILIASAPNIRAMARHRFPDLTHSDSMELQLHHILAVSRFAHHIKRIARNLTGNAISNEEIQEQLYAWIAKYVCANPAPSTLERQEQPLKNAAVDIIASETKPGTHLCRVQLQPHGVKQHLAMHFQLRSPGRGISSPTS
ncbi:MAG: type VI secretion system contractile sheath large subunit [Planctomycetaceae bacterium]|nr:type VI secretion system contractile sheath large subunit [Planctomycetaceae bacterium]